MRSTGLNAIINSIANAGDFSIEKEKNSSSSSFFLFATFSFC